LGLIAAGPAEITADEDHQQMMDQLGIRVVGPGARGDPSGPNPANYDEARASPYPDLPDPLRTKAGKPVTSAAMWWKVRRPEIVEDYEREVYGRVPKDVPAVRWEVMGTYREMLGPSHIPVIARKMIGHVDNAAYPSIAVNIHMTVVLPAGVKGPVPLLILFGRDDYPAPALPSRDEYERIDAAMKAALAKQDPSLAAVFANHPAFTLAAAPVPTFTPRDPKADRPKIEELVANGWGYALLDTASIQADDGAGLRSGIIGLTNKGQPRKPDDWGALRAWAWGASRAFDVLAADPAVDAKHIGIEGVSRWGKAALVTMAFDQRFAMVLVGSSGKGGATPLRRNYGEAVGNLGTGEYHWMAGNFLKYDATAGRYAGTTAKDLPVDSNELIALCAPRLTFISYGVPAAGDAHWLDHRGSYMATVDAGRVFRLLGAEGLPDQGDYRVAQLPPVNTGPIGRELAWRQHDGGHTDLPNITYFVAWADRLIGYSAPATDRR
jgi:hypothetical protein